jgi:glutamyl-tRNA reductase
MSMPQPPQEVQTQEHPAEQRLNEVMNLLKKKKGDQDIQEIVNKYDSFGKKATKKQMHHAVNDLDRARNAMEDAIQARTNLMNNWRSFLTASLERWREYTGQVQLQEAKC